VKLSGNPEEKQRMDASWGEKEKSTKGEYYTEEYVEKKKRGALLKAGLLKQ